MRTTSRFANRPVVAWCLFPDTNPAATTRNWTTHMTRTLQQLTLETGHVRPSPREEVDDRVIERLGTVLARALTGAHTLLPDAIGDYTLTGRQDGHCALLTVWGRAPGRLPWPPPLTARGARGRPPRTPIATIAVAGDGADACAARTWRALHVNAASHGHALATRHWGVPAPPWCATRLDPGVGHHREALDWLSDFARCIAWAWFARH